MLNCTTCLFLFAPPSEAREAPGPGERRRDGVWKMSTIHGTIYTNTIQILYCVVCTMYYCTGARRSATAVRAPCAVRRRA